MAKGRKVAPLDMKESFYRVVASGGPGGISREASDAMADRLQNIVDEVLRDFGVLDDVPESGGQNNPRLTH